MMIEYFFLTAKALTIYSLGFGIAVASDRKKKKEPTFTINHISAVFLPVLLGYIWIHNNSAVFYLAAVLSFISLIVAILIPRSPSKGNESILRV